MRERLLGFLASLILRGLNASVRWEKQGLEVDEQFEGNQQQVHWGYARPHIACFWHCDQLMAAFTYVGYKPPSYDPRRVRRPASVLISQHADGRIIAEAMGNLGIGNIAGSSTRGGARALVRMRKAISKEKVHITITPDGPKGPAQKVKPGVINLASQTGAPILPMSFAFERAWKVKSWDEMLIPKPFTRGQMLLGDPIVVPKDLSEEQVESESKKLEDALNSLKQEAENRIYREHGQIENAHRT